MQTDALSRNLTPVLPLKISGETDSKKPLSCIRDFRKATAVTNSRRKETQPDISSASSQQKQITILRIS